MDYEKLLILKRGRHRVLHLSNLSATSKSLSFSMVCGSRLTKAIGGDIQLVNKHGNCVQNRPEWRIVEKDVLKTELVQLCQACFPNGIDESDLQEK